MGSPTPEQPAKPTGGGLAAFASLLDPNSKPEAGTISRAPVVYEKPGDKEASKGQSKDAINAALRFQPTKRPQQIQAKKSKAGASVARPAVTTNNSSDGPVQSTPAAPAAPAPASTTQRSTLADWAADDDDNYYVGEKRPRGGRKKRKKQEDSAPVVLNWDGIYDPSQPNNYADYKGSKEKYREIREWKDRLHAHEILRRGRGAVRELSEDEDRAESVRNRGFAPPSNYDFAPPATYDDDESPKISSPYKPVSSPPQRSPQATAALPDDPTGDDAYARRMALSNLPQQQLQSSPSPPVTHGPSPLSSEPRPDLEQVQAAPRFQAAAATISRAPVLNAPPTQPSEPSPPPPLPPPSDIPQADLMASDPETPRSLRPGQKGFAARLLSKYGYVPGSGLGATGTGIATPLSVQIDKRKKKSDADGGGYRGPPGAKGRIVGGKKSKAAEEEEAERERVEAAKGKLGEVVCIRGLLRGLAPEDVQREKEEGGVVQGVGEECAGRFGVVERVVVVWDHGVFEGNEEATMEGPPVLLKFTSALSALRAVNALDGQQFVEGGNVVGVKFYETDAFERGDFEALLSKADDTRQANQMVDAWS